jgi:hypothetical protein
MKKMNLMMAVLLLAVLLATGCTALSTPQQKPQDQVAQPGEVKEFTFTLHYGEREVMGLITEERTVTIPEGKHPIIVAIEELGKEPVTENAIVMLPAETEVLGVTVEDDLITIDFNANLRDNFIGGSSSEALLVEGIVNTVTDISDEYADHKVQFLIDGETFESIGGHLSAEEPFKRGQI